MTSAVARSGGDVDAGALADEVIAEALDLDVRDDPALIDLGIDEHDRAAARSSCSCGLKPARADQDRVARLDEVGMPLGKLQAQDVVVGRDRRDRLARHDDAAFRHRHLEHPPRPRREDGAFGACCSNNLPVGAQRLQGSLGDIEARSRLVQLRLRRQSGALQLLRASKIDLRLVALGLLRLDARLQRLHLQRQLLVSDHGDAVAGGDAIALFDGERRDRPADARAGEQVSHRLDRRDHGLPVVDLEPLDRLISGPAR